VPQVNQAFESNGFAVIAGLLDGGVSRGDQWEHVQGA
jgi:hypothetical protein